MFPRSARHRSPSRVILLSGELDELVGRGASAAFGDVPQLRRVVALARMLG